jgi:hypothetical protein
MTIRKSKELPKRLRPVAQAIESCQGKLVTAQDLTSKLTEFIRPFMELRCVGGKLYLGSMFYLDFGGYFSSRSSKGDSIQVGEMTLSVRDVYWRIERSGQIAADAESIDAGQFAVVVEQLQGRRVVSFSASNDRNNVIVDFGDSWALTIDLLNSWETDSDILQISLPDGRRAAITEKSAFDTALGLDQERSANWAQSLRRN